MKATKTKKEINKKTNVVRVSRNNFSYSVRFSNFYFKKQWNDYDVTVTDSLNNKTFNVAPANNKKEFVDAVYYFLNLYG